MVIHLYNKRSCDLVHGSALLLLLVTKLEVLAALNRPLRLVPAARALKAQRDLLGRLGLLVEDGLRLAAKAGLLHVITPLALGVVGRLARLVLRHLVQLVLPALLAGAQRLARLRDDNLW